MKFTLNNFYSNNYKDFIHLEALKNILRQVPQLNLAGVENIDNVLSMEFSVDDWGENPMYIKYIDTAGKKHIVKIRPAVTEQIYEILKAYAKIAYVDEQDKKLKDELHTEITQGNESTLNVSKAYTDTVVNRAKDEINHTIETTKQDLKNYCDNKCEITLTSSKEYPGTKIADKTIELTSDYTQKINEVSKKVDDLDIGGTNLLWGTDTYVNDFWTLPVSNGISHGEREDDGLLSQSIHFWGDDIKAKENMATNYRPIHLIAGHQYTISLQARYYEPNRADIKVTGRNIRVFSDYTDVHEPEGFGLTTELTGEYKRYSHTFTCKQTGDYRGWRFGDWTDAVGYPGGSIFIGEIKIEEGNIPTAWRTAEGELTSRLRGKVENVPKEFFMSLNNTVLDTTSCYARLFRFTDFAIVKISCFIKDVTIEPWTYREVVSAPQAYFKDFSKFDYIKGKKEFSDLGRPYETDFNISNSKIGIYCRGTKIEKENLFLEIAGILYN